MGEKQTDKEYKFFFLSHLLFVGIIIGNTKSIICFGPLRCFCDKSHKERDKEG